MRRDLAIVVDENVPLAVLRENVSVSASGLLSELRVFDVYRGPGVETGRKSIALGLILQDSSRTLTDVEADAVVTGAADSSLNRLDVQGFSSLMALAEESGDIATASRPFDRARSGFVIGEGGVVLVLESQESARRRGARARWAQTPADRSASRPLCVGSSG